jgi:hypothetical protein
VTTSPAETRERAIEAAEATCPRCGTPRDPDQRYCLECGLALPVVTGRLASFRRRWIRKLGWYPGDWVWVSLLTLVVAIVGAVAAILLSRTTDAAGVTFAAPPAVSVAEPSPTPASTGLPATVDTSTLPTAPEPATPTGRPKPATQPPNGRRPWPANRNGWTIVLVSYPKTVGLNTAYATSGRAARAKLLQVGVLDSSRYASLQPGYYVVYTGIYGSKSDADAAVATARQAGFTGAYSRQIAR